MRPIFRPILGIAACAALAGCSHGIGAVAPSGPMSPSQSQISHVQYFGQVFGNAAQVCGAVRAGEARCLSLVRTDVQSRTGASPNVINGYHPADLISAYKLPGGTAGTGQTVAVVDAFDDPNAEADLGVYRSTFGLPACTSGSGCFKKVNQNGNPSPLPPADTSGWSEEESLDLDMVSAICPNCHIILVETNDATFTDLGTGVDSGVALGANVVSNSYGGGEGGTSGFNVHYNHPGHIITASSGDSGFGPQFPAGSQFVVAVGGTTLVHATNTRGWKETAWSGAGSGCSTVYPKPSWQVDPLCSNRTIADTSADSSPQTGVAVYDTYKFVHGWAVFGGTSVAAPLIGGVYALAGNASSLNYASSIYTAPNSTRYDVKSGSNGSCGGTYLCTAKKGYDGPTGMGTPHGVGAF